jgi:PTH1 family peptidyl-tRNA hydrolase
MALLGPHIIVGLGNPGREYEDTRHNAGFRVIDVLAEELGVRFWKVAANALVGEANYKGKKIVLVKPQAFMNLSGGPVKGLTGRYGFSAQDVLVVHDELDLPAGTIRLKMGGGHAGHNGLRSLHQSIGSEYARLRIGIGRPEGRMPPHSYVLQKLKKAELEDFKVTVASAVPMVLKAIEEGVEKAMNECNRDNNAEKESSKGGEIGADSRADSKADNRADSKSPQKKPIGMDEVVAAIESVVNESEAESSADDRGNSAKQKKPVDPSAPTEPIDMLSIVDKA